MTIPLICLLVKNNKKLGIMLTGSLAGICTILTVIMVFVDKIHFLNFDNNSINQYYYAKFYLRGNVYYLGCLMSYFTMRGPQRKPKAPENQDELEEPLISAEEKLRKELEEK